MVAGGALVGGGLVGGGLVGGALVAGGLVGGALVAGGALVVASAGGGALVGLPAIFVGVGTAAPGLPLAPSTIAATTRMATTTPAMISRLRLLVPPLGMDCYSYGLSENRLPEQSKDVK